MLWDAHEDGISVYMPSIKGTRWQGWRGTIVSSAKHWDLKEGSASLICLYQYPYDDGETERGIWILRSLGSAQDPA